MSWKSLFVLGVAGLVACSSSKHASRDDSDSSDHGRYSQADKRQEDVGAQRERVIGQADAWQPGIVRGLEDEILILEPYQQAAGEARIQIEEDIPVFEDDARVSTDVLTPGTDVRVFYRHDATGTPQVVAVEILSDEEVREIRSLFEGQPNQQQDEDSSPNEDDYQFE